MKGWFEVFHVLFSLSHLLATANICNVVLMRNHELFTGIEVKEKDGNVVGASKIAARKVNIEIQNCRVDNPERETHNRILHDVLTYLIYKYFRIVFLAIMEDLVLWAPLNCLCLLVYNHSAKQVEIQNHSLSQLLARSTSSSRLGHKAAIKRRHSTLSWVLVCASPHVQNNLRVFAIKFAN